MTGPIAIIGAAGRIGRVLCEGLMARGHAIRAIDVTPMPEHIETRIADIRDLAAMEAALDGAAAVIHLAATPNAKPGWAVVSSLNIDGTRNVLEAARRRGVGRVAFASSIHVVGGHPAGTPLAPSLPPRPSGPYGVSKIAGEALCRLYADQAGMACLALRICSFRPAPTNVRELTTWLSPADCVRLAAAAVEAPFEGYGMAWGVSANARACVLDPTAEAIGYAPQDDADCTPEGRTLAACNGPLVEEWKTLGGPVGNDDVW